MKPGGDNLSNIYITYTDKSIIDSILLNVLLRKNIYNKIITLSEIYINM